jgi:hypothetical protein
MRNFLLLVLALALAGSAWAAAATDAAHHAALLRGVTSAANPTGPALPRNYNPRKQPFGPKVSIPAFRKVRTITCPPVGSGAYEGLAFDGDSALYQIESVVGGVANLNKYNAYTGTLLTSYNVAVNGYVAGMTYQGGALWIGQWYNSSSGYVDVINRVDTLGNVLRSFTLPSPITGNNIRGVGWNTAGNDLFVTGVNAAVNAGDFWEVDTVTGAIARTVPIGTLAQWPMSGLVRTRGDSLVIWISDDNTAKDLLTINVQGASATLDTIYNVSADLPNGPSGICYDGRYLYVDGETATEIVVYDLMQFNDDIGTTGIISPTTTVTPLTPVTPQVVYTNLGNTTETNFKVGCFVDSSGTIVYRDSSTIASLGTGASDTISFSNWNVGPTGAVYTFKGWCRLAGDGNPSNDTLSRTVRALVGSKALIAFGDLQANSWALAESLMAHDSSGHFSTIDTFCVATGIGGRVLPLCYLTSNNYKVVLTFTNYAYVDPIAMGDTMAAFMEQGGGVVLGVFADYDGWAIGGRYATQYMPFPMSTAQFTAGNLGTVHLPNHPIMDGVSSINVGSFRSASTTMQHGEIIASWSDGTNLVGAFDTLGWRTAELGFFPTTFAIGQSWSGDNTRLMLNAMCWAAGICNQVGVEVQPPLGNQPRVFALAPARPNPVSGTTEIRYQLPTAGPVHIRVYNVAGQVVKTLVDSKQEVGYKSVTWDGRNDRGERVGSGVYLYRMEAGSFTGMRKMVVVR